MESSKNDKLGITLILESYTHELAARCPRSVAGGLPTCYDTALTDNGGGRDGYTLKYNINNIIYT